MIFKWWFPLFITIFILWNSNSNDHLGCKIKYDYLNINSIRVAISHFTKNELNKKNVTLWQIYFRKIRYTFLFWTKLIQLNTWMYMNFLKFMFYLYYVFEYIKTKFMMIMYNLFIGNFQNKLNLKIALLSFNLNVDLQVPVLAILLFGLFGYVKILLFILNMFVYCNAYLK